MNLPTMVRLFLKTIAGIIALILSVTALLALWLWPRDPYLPAVKAPFTVQRYADNPVVHQDLHRSLSAQDSPGGYVNINGPSLIRVPDWVAKPLGKYYLYFAHHKGDRIRLAYGDSPYGPWTVHEPGVLSLADSGFPVTMGEPDPNLGIAALFDTFSLHIVRDYLMLSYRATVTDQEVRRSRGISSAANSRPHIASPDVIIDEVNRRFVLYFHGLETAIYQHSGIAVSADGLVFEALDDSVFSTYLRGFEYGGHYYLLGMPGILYRSDRPDGGFTPRDRALFDPAMRHAAVRVTGDQLHVVWSRAGDAPEGLLYSQVDLSAPDWNDWRATAGSPVLYPEFDWEGAALPVYPSLRGEFKEASHELRDPYIFQDQDGDLYLYYAGAGEQALGAAQLLWGTDTSAR